MRRCNRWWFARGSRPVEVRLSDAVDAPSVLGFFRPAVIVPRSLWSELAPSELKQIILHEMAHLDRGDDWTNLLQKLLRALSPLNPALFWAERHLCLERERACDDAVLDAAGNARAYATCLTKLAENRLVKRAALLAPGLWKRHSELAERVENILHRRRSLGPMLSRGLVAAGLMLSLSPARWFCSFARASLPLPAMTRSRQQLPWNRPIQNHTEPGIRKPYSIPILGGRLSARAFKPSRMPYGRLRLPAVSSSSK